MHLGAWSQGLPGIAKVLSRGDRAPAHWWVVGGCTVGVLSDALSLVVSYQGRNNLWVHHATFPIMGVMFLWGLGYWHTGFRRLVVRCLVPGFLVAWVGLALFAEDLSSFSRYIGPLKHILVLAVASYTLVRRGGTPWLGPLFSQDWPWICGGLALYSAASLSFEPAGAYLAGTRPDLVVAALNLKQAISAIAFTAIAWGMTRPFGPSSSPPRLG